MDTNRVYEMRRLRFIEGKTLEEIGQIHGGISRERVRQLIGNTGIDFRKKWTERYIQNGRPRPKHHTEIRNAPGLAKVWKEHWGKFRHDARSGSALIGQEFEEWISIVLQDNGIENKLMPNHHPFNIFTSSGIRIDVKSSHINAADMPSQHSMSPTWCFNHFKSGKDADFFILCCPDEEELDGYTYFVVPDWEFYGSPEDRVIRIPWPSISQRGSKWHKYHHRLDLLGAPSI